MKIFFLELLIFKKHLINFTKQIKLNDANSIAVEDLISNLRKKFETDVESLGPFKYLMEDIVTLSNEINIGEAQIHNSLQIINRKQEEIGSFVVKINKRKCDECKNEKLY
jgi:hypothetical protein